MCLSDIGSISLERVIFLFDFCSGVYNLVGIQVKPPALSFDVVQIDECFCLIFFSVSVLFMTRSHSCTLNWAVLTFLYDWTLVV